MSGANGRRAGDEGKGNPYKSRLTFLGLDLGTTKTDYANYKSRKFIY